MQHHYRMLLDRCQALIDVDLDAQIVPECHLRGHALGWVRRHRTGYFRLSLSNEGLERWPDFMRTEVLAHELAHVGAMVIAQQEPPHGSSWQTLCRELGGSGSTRHRMPTTPARRSRQFAYQTSDGTIVWLGSTRHSRARRGTRYLFAGHILHYTGQWRWKP